MSKEDARKIIRVLCGCFGLTIAITGLIYLWYSRAGVLDMITEMKPAYSALEVGLGEMREGDHVMLETSVTAGYVLEKYESLSSIGYVNYETTWHYYLVPIIKSDEQGIDLDHMVLVSIKGKYRELSVASENFFEWWNSEDISMDTFPSETILSVDGRVVKLTSEELQLLKNHFEDQDYRQFVAPYVIKPLWDGGSKEDAFMGKAEIITGTMFLAVGLIMVIIALPFKRKNRQNKNTALPAKVQHSSNKNRKYMDNIVESLSAEQKAEILSLINSGRLIEAVNLFREITGVGLADAKDAIENFKRKNRKNINGALSTEMRHGSKKFEKYMDGVVNNLSAEQKADVLYLINSGKPLEAIKLFRDMTGVALIHAKDAIDHYDIYLK